MFKWWFEGFFKLVVTDAKWRVLILLIMQNNVIQLQESFQLVCTNIVSYSDIVYKIS